MADTKMVGVVFSLAEYAVVQAKAERAGKTISAYLRERVLTPAERETKKRGRPVKDAPARTPAATR